MPAFTDLFVSVGAPTRTHQMGVRCVALVGVAVTAESGDASAELHRLRRWPLLPVDGGAPSGPGDYR